MRKRICYILPSLNKRKMKKLVLWSAVLPFVLFVTLALTLGVSSAQAQPTGILDQVNDPPWEGGWMNIVPANQVGQSFVPTMPVLTDVEVDILTGNPGSGDDSITMKIKELDGQVLTSKTVFVSDGFEGWLHFDIPGEGITVKPGTSYVIQLEDTGKVTFGWKYSGDTYPHGNRFFFGSPQDGDFFFKTYGLEIGSINGHVTDTAGNPIKGAVVIAIKKPAKEWALTKPDGYYEVPDLEPGTYCVLAIKRGYKLGIKKAEVMAGETTIVDFTLSPKLE